MSYLIGLDIGTTSTKAVLYDPEDGRLAGMATRPTPVLHPSEGWSEHDPEEIWRTAAACLKEAAGSRKEAIAGMAISSFAEAGLALDEHGAPLYPIIAWYDPRTAAQVEGWEARFSIEELYAISGQRLSPTFGVNKWLWLRQNQPEAAGKMRHWLSVPDYILWRLSGEMSTDYTIASRTMMFDQGKRQWSGRILEMAGLKTENLPGLHPSGTLVGRLSASAALETGLAAGIPCVLGGHDHLCAALAVGATRPGVVVDSMGTAESILVPLPTFQSSPALIQGGFACYAHVAPDCYVLKAGLHAAGGSIEWLVRTVSGAGTQPLPYAELERAAESGVGLRVGPLWLPHFSGSGSPEADWHSRAALIGVRLEDTPGDLLRGLLESLAFWLHHNQVEIERLSGQSIHQIILLGGANQIGLLARLKAATTNLPVVLPNIPEASAIGAALLAGMGAGVFKDAPTAAASLRYDQTCIQPDPALVEWYAPIYERIYIKLYPALKELWQEM
jgi:xylulokinase